MAKQTQKKSGSSPEHRNSSFNVTVLVVLAALITAVLLVPRGQEIQGQATAASSEFGVLDIKFDPPDALFYIDGQIRGNSPRTIIGLPTGGHSLTISAEGYYSYEANFIVLPGKTTFLTVSLVEDDSGLVVNAGANAGNGNTIPELNDRISRISQEH